MARVVRQISGDGERFIIATANTRPERLGRPFTRWSIRKLADHLHLRAARRIVVGRKRLRQILHQHRITYVSAHFPQRLFGLRQFRTPGVTTVASMTARPPLAEQFDLQPHPEGGWFRETYRSAVAFEPDGYPGSRAAATAILFLLEPGDSSAWHTVRSDEIWFWHSGGPLALTVGRDSKPTILSAECPQILVPAGEWQSARPAGDEYVLVSCVVSPGFDFADFYMP